MTGRDLVDSDSVTSGTRRLRAYAALSVAVGLALFGLAARFVPHYRPHIVAAAGLTWRLWGGWQFWVLLALT